MRISAADAAARLGVKRETLYAYVSRGMLTSERAPDGRTSTFDAAEVASMAARTRGGGRAGRLELVVASGITRLDDGELRYRGIDVHDLVPGTPFEAVAEFLWTGELREAVAPWPAVDVPAPPVATAMDRLRVTVAMAGGPLRYDLSTPAVVEAGRRIIAAMAGPGPGSVAGRLATTLGAEDETFINSVLVLMADHELAASTLAARIAASVRADPYSVIATGLGVIAGPLHGAVSQDVIRLLREIGEPGRAAEVVGERLRRGERIPGLGHKVYRTADPRAEILVTLLQQSTLPGDRWAVVEELIALCRERFALVVNIDMVLGGYVWAAGLDIEAAECMFAVARTAGWLAHAIEEYGEEAVRFRPRAVYTGRS